VTSFTAHHARALVSSTVDGLSVGLAEAALDHPARSPARRRLYLASGAAAMADAAVHELPALRRAAHGVDPEPPSPGELANRLDQGLVTCAWGLAVTVADGPLARVLRRRGARRPHLLLGVAVAAATAASTLPGRWRQATMRALTDRGTATLDDELAALLDSPSS
jgi:hypothetical protein